MGLRQFLFFAIIFFVGIESTAQDTATCHKRDSVLLQRYLYTKKLNYQSISKINFLEYNINNTWNRTSNWSSPSLNEYKWTKGWGASSSTPNYGGPIDPGPISLRRNRIPFSTWARQYDYLNH